MTQSKPFITTATFAFRRNGEPLVVAVFVTLISSFYIMRKVNDDDEEVVYNLCWNQTLVQLHTSSTFITH